MMGKSIWGMVGFVAFLCLPLMGVRGNQAQEELDGVGPLNFLREEIPRATVGWDRHREEYLATQGRIDALLALKREPDNIWNVDLHRQRLWSLIFREIANMERFGQDLAWKMQKVRAFTQAVMELEEAQRNGERRNEEIFELHRRALEAQHNLMHPFSFEETDAHIMGLRRQVEEDERYIETYQRWLAEINRPE